MHGGFGLSGQASKLFAERKGIEYDSYGYYSDLYEDEDYDKAKVRLRTDPILIQVVEELGEKANGAVAKLKVVEIPDGIEFTIEEYDGVEWVAEKHRTWS